MEVQGTGTSCAAESAEEEHGFPEKEGAKGAGSGFWKRDNPSSLSELSTAILVGGRGPFSTAFIRTLKLRTLKLFPNEVTPTITEDRIQRRRLTLHGSELGFYDWTTLPVANHKLKFL